MLLSLFDLFSFLLSSSCSPKPLPSTLELPSGEVFENPNSSRSSESGFTDFVQYQASEEPALPTQPSLKTGCSGSLPASQNKPQDKPVMQCCLEHFQHFLSRLVTLYITPGMVEGAGGERSEVVRAEPEGGAQQNGRDVVEVPGQRECLAAFTAACQLFLECSSFPVYIAEGNLKSTPLPKEQTGKTD